MKKNRDGITLIALIITIIVLLILAGVSLTFVVGDNGIITNAMKMEVETAKGEVRDRILLLLNEELVSASAEILGTSNDIGTVYNEPALVHYLTNHQNYTGTDHDDTAKIECIKEFDSSDGEDDIVNVEVKFRPTEGTLKDLVVKSKYKVVSQNVCPDGDKYGIGKNTKEGNIFTLEAIVEQANGEHVPYTNANKGDYKGKFDLKYYDKDKNPVILETVSLYLTNQS